MLVTSLVSEQVAELISRQLAPPVSVGALPVVTFGLSTFTLVQQTAMCVRCPGFMLCGELQSVSSLLLQRPVQYGRVSSVIAFDGSL